MAAAALSSALYRKTPGYGVSQIRIFPPAHFVSPGVISSPQHTL